MRTIVTGAARGIGRAVCLRRARDARRSNRPAHIAAVDRAHEDELDTLLAELRDEGVEATPFMGDLGDPEEPARIVAEAADAATFAGLEGTAVLRIADLSRPLVDVDVDLDDGGAGVALRWTGMRPSGGGFAKGTAGTDRIDGRFHGPEHQEAWGVFDTATHVGAIGAKREP